MREGRRRTGLRIAVSTAIGLSLALTANYLALAQPQPGQTSPARDPDSAPPYPHEGEAVSKPPAALPTPHTVACSESFGKDSSHLKLAMGFGFRNVTATDVEANGTKVAASVIFPDDPQQRLEVWWKNATSSGTYQIVITGQSDWTAPGGLRLGLTLAELEKLNHKSFKLKGFDKNGIAATSDWGGGELASLAGAATPG